MRRGRILQFEREDCGVKIFRIGITIQLKEESIRGKRTKQDSCSNFVGCVPQRIT
ncbi:hypothetical protein PCC7424_3292 [Gloeothece citriformis PCC 7424]|uniref:Uncharacterized protein n=1 Tax=Gloeothece citriformis (strain PCC 7424) TaxID=65393 RepID=B7KDZ3_GLOC7|nr:hypothetical protein PCC7424_3292 [Gloeothece citriformis PCC 7424]